MNKEAASWIEAGGGKPDVRPFAVAALVGVAYYFGTVVGFALTFQPKPISILWPPNAILLGALLLTPVNWWWLLLLCAFPAHLAAQMQSGVPAAMVMGWFVSNCSEALIGAAAMRKFIPKRLGFDSIRHVSLFLFLCAFLAPFLSSFLDAAFVRLIGWGQGSYWQLWRMRFFSNVLAVLAFIPVLLTCSKYSLVSIRKAPFPRRLEICLWAFALLAVSFTVFISEYEDRRIPPLILYAPLPILFWAAVRFNPFTLSLSFLSVTFLVIWCAAHGYGPFALSSPVDNVLPIQLFLIGVAIPLLLLSAAMQERRQAQEALHRNRKQVEAAARAGAALRESEARFFKIFRLSPDAMSISCGIGGRILDVNDRWENLFGYQRKEVIGKTVRQLSLYASEEDFPAVLERGRSSGCIRNLEVKILDKSGTVRQAIFSGEAINSGGEPCFLAIIRDITEQRRTEAEAQQQRKQLTYLTRAVVLGELSGALAHELNQPLTAILANAQAAQRFMDRHPVNLEEIGDILDDIVDADKRAGEVIRRLRALFMKGEPTLQLLDVNEVVHEALDLAHGDLIRRRITMTLKLASGFGAVYGDRVQLQQVFLNLIVNACEAMNDIAPDKRLLTFSSEPGADGSVLIAVSDSGPGIAAEATSRLFESFFTTKVHGLGFGLSISRAIVEEHGGRIEAINNPGGGATFRIVLPTQSGGLS